MPAGRGTEFARALEELVEAARREIPRAFESDADETMVTCTRAASYGESSLRELPSASRCHGFVRRGGRSYVRPRFRKLETVVEHDIRDPAPSGPFDLVLCRNLAFTYFDLSLQREVAWRLARPQTRRSARDRLPRDTPGRRARLRALVLAPRRVPQIRVRSRRSSEELLSCKERRDGPVGKDIGDGVREHVRDREHRELRGPRLGNADRVGHDELAELGRL